MSDIERSASRVDKVASSTEDEQQLAEVNLESLRFLGQSLLTGDVYDQISNLPNLEEAVEKRWRTEIPGVVWKDVDVKKINMPDVDHFTLTKTSHTKCVLPCLEEDIGGARVPSMGRNTGSDTAPCPDVTVTRTVHSKHDQDISESGEHGGISSFSLSGSVSGICVYNNTIFLVKFNESSLYIYSVNGDLIKTKNLDGINWTRDLVLVRLKDNDKLIITAGDPHCVCHLPIRGVGDQCVLGKKRKQTLNYSPHGMCSGDNNSLVVTDQSNDSLHVYNSAGDEINTIKLPFGVRPQSVSSDPSGGYIVTDESKQIIWIDGQGAQQRRHKYKACVVELSDMCTVVRDSENRYLVADNDNNQLLLFSKDGGDVICLVKDKIIKPVSLFLDQQHGKLYVGTCDGQVVIYAYYILL